MATTNVAKEQDHTHPAPLSQHWEATKLAGKLLTTEGSTLSACGVFVTAIALDALNSLPTSVVTDVPSSMRTSSMITVAMIAAPSVVAEHFAEQRLILSLILLTLSFLGMHRAGLYARFADALYSMISGWCTAVIFSISGVGPGESKTFDPRQRRECLVCLGGTTLGYAGARILRCGLTHAAEVRAFTQTHDEFEVLGYAIADDVIAMALTFGGSVCIGAAAIILLNHHDVYNYGSAPVSNAIGMLSIPVFTVAFIVQVSSYSRLDDLDAIFGSSACMSLDADDCDQAVRARRMHVSNTASGTLWTCAVGMTLLAFPRDRRCKSRRHYFDKAEAAAADVNNGWDVREAERFLEAQESGFVSLIAAAVITFIVIVYVDADSILVGLNVVLMFGSIPLAWYGDTSLACFAHAAGLYIYFGDKATKENIFNPVYLTHWVMHYTAAVVAILGISVGISKVLWRCGGGKRYVHGVESFSAALMITLASVQLIVVLATTGLQSGYDGALIVMERSNRYQGMEWSIQHFISFFFTAAIVGGRFEHCEPHIDPAHQRMLWYIPTIVLGLIWFVCTAASSNGISYDAVTDLWSLFLVVLGAFVPWVITGYVVCGNGVYSIAS
jgi:hypothetical protein